MGFVQILGEWYRFISASFPLEDPPGREEQIFIASQMGQEAIQRFHIIQHHPVNIQLQLLYLMLTVSSERLISSPVIVIEPWEAFLY